MHPFRHCKKTGGQAPPGTSGAAAVTNDHKIYIVGKLPWPIYSRSPGYLKIEI